TEESADLLGVDVIVLGLAAVDGTHVERVAEDEGDAVFGAQVADPVSLAVLVFHGCRQRGVGVGRSRGQRSARRSRAPGGAAGKDDPGTDAAGGPPIARDASTSGGDYRARPLSDCLERRQLTVLWTDVRGRRGAAFPWIGPTGAA